VTATFLDPISFAAGVWLLSEVQTAELEQITARIERRGGAEADERAIRAMEAASAFIRANVDAQDLARTAARIRRGELRVPLYDVEDASVIRTPVQ
jgi:hypothetical protein